MTHAIHDSSMGSSVYLLRYYYLGWQIRDNFFLNTYIYIFYLLAPAKCIVKSRSRNVSRTTKSDSKQSLYYCTPPAFRRTLIPYSYRCKIIDHYTVPISANISNSRHSDYTTRTK